MMRGIFRDWVEGVRQGALSLPIPCARTYTHLQPSEAPREMPRVPRRVVSDLEWDADASCERNTNDAGHFL